MRKTTFGQVRLGDRFLFDGLWYIKVDPTVARLNRAFNAVLAIDDSQGYWFESNEIVYQ